MSFVRNRTSRITADADPSLLVRRIARRAIAGYENLPLPAGSILGIVGVLLLHRVHPVPIPGSRAVQRTAGCVLSVAGCALNVWALAERRHHASSRFRLEHPDSVVTTGPYAYSRHPMYLGWWLIHVGISLWRGSAWIAATAPVGVLAEHVLSVAEERALRSRFPSEYERYAERVPRYLGRRRRAARTRRGRPQVRHVG